MRCFISIDLPENIVGEIKKIQKRLPEFAGKKTESENLHLTLKFLGEIDNRQIKEIKKRMNSINFPKFIAEIDAIGVFSEKFIRILWLHLRGPEKLQKEIDKALEGAFEPEQRFMSHLTIARIKSIKNKGKFLEKLKEIKVPKMTFNIDNFTLKSSTLKPEGPVYEEMQVYGLN